jgi:hypothetical protein
LSITRDDTLLTTDGTATPFEPASADTTTANGNENPASINIEPTTIVIIIIIAVVEGKLPGIEIPIFHI